MNEASEKQLEEPVEIVDFGDACEQTKQWGPSGGYPDSQYFLSPWPVTDVG